MDVTIAGDAELELGPTLARSVVRRRAYCRCGTELDKSCVAPVLDHTGTSIYLNHIVKHSDVGQNSFI